MQSKTEMKSVSNLKAVPSVQLKNCLNRVYTLDRSEKYELFLLELGVKKAARVSALNSKPSVSLYLQNKSYVFSSMYPEGKTVRVRFKPGEKTYRKKPDGKFIPAVFDISENILTEKLNLGGLEIVIQRVFTKMELIVTMEVNDVKCIRFFSQPKSRHSIETETSRRSSICHQSVIDYADEFESVTEDDFTNESENSSERDVCY